MEYWLKVAYISMISIDCVSVIQMEYWLNDAHIWLIGFPHWLRLSDTDGVLIECCLHLIDKVLVLIASLRYRRSIDSVLLTSHWLLLISSQPYRRSIDWVLLKYDWQGFSIDYVTGLHMVHWLRHADTGAMSITSLWYKSGVQLNAHWRAATELITSSPTPSLHDIGQCFEDLFSGITPVLLFTSQVVKGSQSGWGQVRKCDKWWI